MKIEIDNFHGCVLWCGMSEGGNFLCGSNRDALEEGEKQTRTDLRGMLVGDQHVYNVGNKYTCQLLVKKWNDEQLKPELKLMSTAEQRELVKRDTKMRVRKVLFLAIPCDEIEKGQEK